jgi:hypothetical protein
MAILNIINRWTMVEFGSEYVKKFQCEILNRKDKFWRREHRWDIFKMALKEIECEVGFNWLTIE